MNIALLAAGLGLVPIAAVMATRARRDVRRRYTKWWVPPWVFMFVPNEAVYRSDDPTYFWIIVSMNISVVAIVAMFSAALVLNALIVY
jgi:hypothetical protein